jgi:O-antigen biosynthesis protein
MAAAADMPRRRLKGKMLESLKRRIGLGNARMASRPEVEHWGRVEAQAKNGARLFWLNHPRVAHHYHRKAMIDNRDWREWIVDQKGGPLEHVLELGCGAGAALRWMCRRGYALKATGIEIDEARFAGGMEAAQGLPAHFVAADINTLNLKPFSYDLIYSLQSFHHFENLEHIMREVCQALAPGGCFVLDEYVGPARFQWTDTQLELTKNILGLLPKELRLYANGVEKRAEGRSTVEEVIRVCPSEAIRSNEIVALFYQYFDVVDHKKMGGTIQHLLYSGIIQNFPDDDPDVDCWIDCIDGLETELIEIGAIPSDFDLLIGRAPASTGRVPGCAGNG